MIFFKETGMKSGFRGLAEKDRSTAAGILITVLLLFPGSISVLCIAPGHHIAIEDINALCCAPAATAFVSSISGPMPNNALEIPADCNNCTDLFLVSDGSGILVQSGRSVIAGPFDAGLLDSSPPPDLSASLGRSDRSRSPDAPAPACPSVPLRC